LWAARLYRRRYLGPLLERILLTGHDLHRELLVTRGGERADAVAELRRRSGEGRHADQLGGDEALFLGPHPHEVPLVELEVAGVGRRVGLVLRAEGRHRRTQLGPE